LSRRLLPEANAPSAAVVLIADIHLDDGGVEGQGDLLKRLQRYKSSNPADVTM
jgi:hypothetical protein